jgi:general secretion pathway protein I
MESTTLARYVGRPRPHERTTARLKARGFTLIELLIAVAVFAVVAVTVYTRSGDALRQVGGLEERTLTTWIAENQLATLRLARMNVDSPMPTGKDSRQVTMAGRNWAVDVRITDTTHPWLRRADIDVAHAETPDTVVTSLTGFIGRY